MLLKGLVFGGLSAVLVLVLSVLLLGALGVEVAFATLSSLALLALLALVEELGRGLMLYKLFEKAPWHIGGILTFALGFFGVEALLKYEQLEVPLRSLAGLAGSPFSHILFLSLVAHLFFTLLWYWLSRRSSVLSMSYFTLTLALVGLAHFIWNATILKVGL